MRAPKNSWPALATSEISRGALFFAQHMREMLTQSSFESFRVTTLDVLSRVRELAAVLREVAVAHLPTATVEPVLDEVLSSLLSDPVARDCVAYEAQVLQCYRRDMGKKRFDIPYLLDFCTLLEKRLGEEYGEKIEEKILNLYADKSRRDDLRGACSAYCSHLINIGFNKSYVLRLIEDRFFTGDLGKVEKRTMQRFFSALNRNDRSYRIWVETSGTTANFLTKSRLADITITSFTGLPVDVASGFSARPSFDAKSRYIETCAKAKDPYSAAAKVHQSLASIESFSILNRDAIDLHWNSIAYVRTPRASSGEFIEKRAFAIQGKPISAKGSTAASVRLQIRRGLTEFDAASTERILSAVNTGALARSSPNLENHLISLWSAIEVLLSNPPHGIPRIVHYVDLLAPCICARYVRRYIVAVLNGIRLSHQKPVTALMESMSLPMTDDYTRFTHLCFDPTFKTEQRELLKLLTNNPLVLHRLWKLEKNFSNPKAYISAVEGHEERVRWQLHRIYRTRNQLVHAGSVPVYLEPLVLNMTEYFRTTVGPIIRKAAREQKPSAVDEIVTEIGIDYEISKARVREVKSVTFDPQSYAHVYR